MALVRFTDPDGHGVWINPHWVTKVRLPIPGRHAGNANTLIISGTVEQAVQEEIKVVLKLLEGTPTDDPDAVIRRASNTRSDPNTAAT